MILEKQHFELKTENRVGENVSLAMNQSKVARLDNLFIAMSPSRAVQSLK
jgi:hypothetical protein